MIQLVASRSTLLAKLWASKLSPQLTLLQAAQYMSLDPTDIEHFEGDPIAMANAIWDAGLFFNQGEEPGTGWLVIMDEAKFRAKFPGLEGLIPAFNESGVFLPSRPRELRLAAAEARPLPSLVRVK